MKPALLLLAAPLFAQLMVTCPSPGTTATVRFTGPAGSYIRIEQNPDGRTYPHDYVTAVKTLAQQQIGPVPSGSTYTLATAPGPWLAYAFTPPYSLGAVQQFTCDPPSATGLIVMVDGKVVATGVTTINLVSCVQGPARPAECDSGPILPNSKPWQVDILLPW